LNGNERVQDVSISMYDTVVKYDNNSLPMVASADYLGSSVAGTNSRAVAGDVAFGAAGIASALLGLGAIAANVAGARAVIALGALHTVAGQMAYTTARVAGLLGSTTTTAERAVRSSSRGSLRARTGDVPNLSALVALGARRSAAVAPSSSSSAAAGCSSLGAVAGDMALLAALVA